ncbi:cytochrome d ubiquinol oxidase subunit II [Amycolatopsis magusensis]|uniref:cytochrome d ubiquinol oxidase subunit II n=1 Tax=Amycolatopsis magusensis TaxID=882444 RepID=UPI0024A7D6BC|nr:cytochrome d ubiquinol oxidase subunit II [Amycolatopsis magusensis]MDI5977435.1 cytochrome d ubiquinol oxidase subunit II [Amycolatopsis magusensis]
MELFLWCLLGLLLAGYFALAGYDYGVGLLLRAFGRDESERRRVLGSFGPFFLGNEVWLVAAVGLLFGAFPLLEGKVFKQNYLVVVAMLVGLVAFTAAVQLRSRRPGAGRGGWDLLIVGGAVVTTGSWGVFFGNLVRGLPATGPVPVADPFSVLWGLGFLALFALHGAVFLTVRGDAELAAKAGRLVRRLLPVVAGFVVVVAGWMGLSAQIMSTVDQVWPAVLVLVAAAVALVVVWRGSPRVALRGTMTLAVLPVVLVGTLRFPYLLLSLDFEQAAASPGTLRLLTFVAVPTVAVVVLVQWLTWRANRRPISDRSLLHF